MLSFLKKLFGSNPNSGEPTGCCGGGCCAHAGNMKQMLGLSDEDWAKLSQIDEKIVVGKVIEVTPHPDPKITKVQITQTDIGHGQTEQILCGGINVTPGIIVAVATVGAKLSKDFEIGIRAIRGAESHGMICARSELGLSLNGEEKGMIWVLASELENKLGTPLCDLV